MRRQSRLLPVLLLFVATAVVPQETARTSQEQEIEEIAAFLLDLEDQKRKLLEVLSPAAREEVLQRVMVLEKQRAKEGRVGAQVSEAEDGAHETGQASVGGKPQPSEAAPDVLVMPTRIEEPAPAVVTAGEPRPVDVSKKPSTEPAESQAKDLPLSSGRARCAAWTIFDTNGDGELSGADRYWRHFFVWIDDGDGVPEDEELEDSFALGMRKLSLDLRSYEGAKNSTGVVERRLHSGRERLRVEILRRGRGSGGSDYGFLALDVAGLVRGNGPRVRKFTAEHQEGEILTSGFVLVEQGVEIEVVGVELNSANGTQTDAGGPEESEPSEARWLPLLCARTVR